MKKLIFTIIIIVLLVKLASCSLNTLNTITKTKEELEKRIETNDNDFIKRLKEGL